MAYHGRGKARAEISISFNCSTPTHTPQTKMHRVQVAASAESSSSTPDLNITIDSRIPSQGVVLKSHLLAELEEGRRSLLLLLPSVDIHHGDVDVVQQLRVELDGVTRRKENLVAHPKQQRRTNVEDVKGVVRGVQTVSHRQKERAYNLMAATG